MFENNGDMQITKSRSILKQKLQVDECDRICPVPDAIIIDGCAMLWVIPWPTNGTVKDFVINILTYVEEQLQICDTNLVFYIYYNDSIKNATRIARAGKEASRQHQLNLMTPLPPQKVILTVTANKVQLISIIYNIIYNTH